MGGAVVAIAAMGTFFSDVHSQAWLPGRLCRLRILPALFLLRMDDGGKNYGAPPSAKGIAVVMEPNRCPFRFAKRRWGRFWRMGDEA